MFNKYINNVAVGIENDRSIDDDSCTDYFVKKHAWHTTLQLIQKNVALTDGLFYFSEVSKRNGVSIWWIPMIIEKDQVMAIFHQTYWRRFW